MSRITLAFSSFFRLLFGGNLSPEAVNYLPEDVKPKLLTEKSESTSEAETEKKPAKKKEPPKKKTSDNKELHRDGALALLALLQREGRLVDFLLESLDDYKDVDVGAAVRDIHRGCSKVLEEHLVLEAVMPGAEDDDVSVPDGFDPGEVRLVGEVKGDPPFKGVLRHHGWRATDVKLPTLSDGVDRRVIAPAEVEISG
jgi:hypothetical protein